MNNGLRFLSLKRLKKNEEIRKCEKKRIEIRVKYLRVAYYTGLSSSAFCFDFYWHTTQKCVPIRRSWGRQPHEFVLAIARTSLKMKVNIWLTWKQLRKENRSISLPSGFLILNVSLSFSMLLSHSRILSIRSCGQVRTRKFEDARASCAQTDHNNLFTFAHQPCFFPFCFVIQFWNFFSIAVTLSCLRSLALQPKLIRIWIL